MCNNFLTKTFCYSIEFTISNDKTDGITNETLSNNVPVIKTQTFYVFLPKKKKTNKKK